MREGDYSKREVKVTATMKTPAERFRHYCQAGDVDAVKQMIDEEGVAIVNEMDDGGMNGLMHAALDGRVVVLEHLLSIGAKTSQMVPVWDPYNRVMLDHEGASALHIAAQGNEVECVRLLLKHGLDPTAKDNEGRTALEWANDLGHLKVARALTDGTVDEHETSLRDTHPVLATEAKKSVLGECCEVLLVIALGLALYWFGFKRLLAEEGFFGHREL